MRLLKDFPDVGQLTKAAEGLAVEPLSVNAHIHTPYSFSSFSGMEQAFEMAASENVKALGINDFYETDGYIEFSELACRNGVFPIFGIEAIALSKDLQNKGVRVNDPGNPGRTYLCGKGLDYPANITGKCRETLESVKAESQRQIAEMLDRLNGWLNETGTGITLTYDEVRSRFARRLVRERHIAQALRTAVFERYAGDAQRREALRKICGTPVVSDVNNAAALENELRNSLLKAGKKAFVPEDEKAFMSVEQFCEIILNAGGIPCYPVLLDDAAGKITEFETDRENLLQSLTDMNIRCIELIPQRNRIETLEPFVRFFYEKGFAVTLGTEHNAPGLTPLTPHCSGNVPLSGFLRQVNYEGACVIAAHQYLRAKGETGYTDESGKTRSALRDSLALLGNAVIRRWIAG